eukprot:TRINITY_DN67821_c5_g7_i7.p1 TRINITY_DN67821_c5_g7~~TRINITY_DN67821_c5_g7_i7.p1  ORF type:complete len:872 (+),score=53.75 TRINITY_DN67821_c5_g7_i7:32-2647(+)
MKLRPPPPAALALVLLPFLLCIEEASSISLYEPEATRSPQARLFSEHQPAKTRVDSPNPCFCCGAYSSPPPKVTPVATCRVQRVGTSTALQKIRHSAPAIIPAVAQHDACRATHSSHVPTNGVVSRTPDVSSACCEFSKCRQFSMNQCRLMGSKNVMINNRRQLPDAQCNVRNSIPVLCRSSTMTQNATCQEQQQQDPSPMETLECEKVTTDHNRHLMVPATCDVYHPPLIRQRGVGFDRSNEVDEKNLRVLLVPQQHTGNFKTNRTCTPVARTMHSTHVHSGTPIWHTIQKNPTTPSATTMAYTLRTQNRVQRCFSMQLNEMLQHSINTRHYLHPQIHRCEQLPKVEYVSFSTPPEHHQTVVHAATPWYPQYHTCTHHQRKRTVLLGDIVQNIRMGEVRQAIHKKINKIGMNTTHIRDLHWALRIPTNNKVNEQKSAVFLDGPHCAQPLLETVFASLPLLVILMMAKKVFFRLFIAEVRHALWNYLLRVGTVHCSFLSVHRPEIQHYEQAPAQTETLDALDYSESHSHPTTIDDHTPVHRHIDGKLFPQECQLRMGRDIAQVGLEQETTPERAPPSATSYSRSSSPQQQPTNSELCENLDDNRRTTSAQLDTAATLTEECSHHDNNDYYNDSDYYDDDHYDDGPDDDDDNDNGDDDEHYQDDYYDDDCSASTEKESGDAGGNINDNIDIGFGQKDREARKQRAWSSRYQFVTLLYICNSVAIYEAKDKQTGETVAVKRICISPNHPKEIERAVREHSLLRRCQHPFVVEVLATHMGEVDPVTNEELLLQELTLPSDLTFQPRMTRSSFLVMPRYPTDLRGFRHNPPPLVHLFRWWTQLLHALAFMHTQGVMHRQGHQTWEHNVQPEHRHH